MTKDINAVKDFWENNPLFSGESQYSIGSKEFFDEHNKILFESNFAGQFEKKPYIPKNLLDNVVLDLGCGVGFWTIEIQKRSPCKEFFACDLTEKAIEMTKKRLEINNMTANLSIQNAEKLTYEDAIFDHVNCQGVIHHTPDTQAAISEIARVLKEGGTACISVYYKNFFLKNWKFFSYLGKTLHKFGGKLKGRGRESIFTESDPNEITRLYDGNENPIGKAYSKREIKQMLEPVFEVENYFLCFFPERSLPFKIPKFFHRFLDSHFGFMIHFNLKKRTRPSQ